MSPQGLAEADQCEPDIRPIRNTFGIEINSRVLEWGGTEYSDEDGEKSWDASINTSTWGRQVAIAK